MKRFEFTEDLLTGIADVDEDHQNLFEIGNTISNPNFIHSDTKTMEETLSFLDDYIIYHFAAEEYAMYNTGYPGLEKHALKHKEFRELMSDYLDKAGKEGISKEFILKISFAVENWLIEHIRVADRAFARYLSQQKIDQPQLPGVQQLKQAGKLSAAFNEGLVKNR